MDVVKGSQKDQLIALLQELAQQSETKSKRARLEEIFGEVEAQLSQGVRQKHVMAALAKGGLVFTLRSFETTCARIRKRRGRNLGREIITHHKTDQAPKAIEPGTEDTPRPRPATATARESRLPEPETAAHSAVQSTKPPGMTEAAWIAEQARAKPKKH